ncbi:MAG: ACT domain-containing protein [Deltaproteobacteria bacterium]|nr:ACT domain-containing protein [Deltaproteobacteria bacterium]
MEVERQLSLFLDNRPGVLAAVCRDLAAHRINIEAITVANLVDHALVRMVVSDAHAAVHLLEERGVLVILSDVLAIELPDRPGAMGALAERLGRADVNIDYMYGSSRGSRAGRPTVFLRVADLTRARRVLARWTPAAAPRRGRTPRARVTRRHRRAPR